MYRQLISLFPLSPKERLEVILLPTLKNNTATLTQLEDKIRVIRAWIGGLDAEDVYECYHLYLEALAELADEGKIRIIE